MYSNREAKLAVSKVLLRTAACSCSGLGLWLVFSVPHCR